jgi:hypothetical protein
LAEIVHKIKGELFLEEKNVHQAIQETVNLSKLWQKGCRSPSGKFNWTKLYI